MQLLIDGAQHPLGRRRQRDLRRRPAASLREPRKGGGGPAGHRVGGAASLMSATTLFDKIWSAHEVAPRSASTSTCTSCTRSRARRRSTGCGSPAARCAGPTARSPPPTTTCRPTARRSPPGSATSCRASRSRRSSATAPSSASRSTRSARTGSGIVHIIGPELGVTQPGMTIVCGDSHTATHGAFGALAFGIGTCEVEHVLATQTLAQPKPRSHADPLRGRARPGRDRQGPDPRHDRPDGHRRRRRATWSSTPARRSRRSRWRAA